MDNKTNKQELSRDAYCIFRLPKEGGRVIWEVTNQCNYTCHHCVFAAIRESIPGELSTEQMFQTSRELKNLGFSYIKGTGGEPFIRKDILDILTLWSELGFVFDLSTNASLINESKAKRLNELNPKMVHVSLDGHTAQIQESVRGKNSYSQTIRGIKHLVAAGNYVRIGANIFKGNEAHLDAMVSTVEALGVNEIIFSFMEPAGKMKGDYSIISNIPIPQAKEHIEKIAQKYSGSIKVNYAFTEELTYSGSGVCPGAERFLFIDNLGRLSPCTWTTEKSPEYRTHNTLKEKTVAQLLQEPEILAYKDMVKQYGSGCPMRMR